MAPTKTVPRRKCTRAELRCLRRRWLKAILLHNQSVSSVSPSTPSLRPSSWTYRLSCKDNDRNTCLASLQLRLLYGLEERLAGSAFRHELPLVVFNKLCDELLLDLLFLSDKNFLLDRSVSTLEIFYKCFCIPWGTAVMHSWVQKPK